MYNILPGKCNVYYLVLMTTIVTIKLSINLAVTIKLSINLAVTIKLSINLAVTIKLTKI
jgi:hypothetical protein